MCVRRTPAVGKTGSSMAAALRDVHKLFNSRAGSRNGVSPTLAAQDRSCRWIREEPVRQH